MRIPRIYTESRLQPGMTLLLPEQAGEHVVRVLRLERGAVLVLFNGDGREYDAQLTTVAKRAVTAQITGMRDVHCESPLRITLAQSVARGEKMDWILQKATELGVACIVPLITQRTEVKLDDDRTQRRLTHWNHVIAAACEQSGRNRLPTLDAPLRLDRWLETLGDDGALRLTLLPQGTVQLRELPSLDRGVLLAVGPEGGFSEQDIALLEQSNFLGLRLGPRVLRTETAGIAALAALQALHGDL